MSGLRTQAPTEWIDVEVAYAGEDRQHLVPLRMTAGVTVADALALATAVPAAARAALATGIWGRPVPREQRLRNGDRIELYHALVIDPREARRARAVAIDRN